MKKIIQSGSRAVIINEQEGFFWANLYVNVKKGVELADITPLRWSGKTLKGAEKWAARQLQS